MKKGERAGVPAGRGCGHSVFGTASTGAAIAVKQAIEQGSIRGTIRLYGTPAEETGIGKTYMLREGAFKDVDVVLAWHASDVTASAYNYTKANVSVKFRFAGLPAHASVSPHEGRSALDAVELMNVGVNYMREHNKEDARIHYVVTSGGGQPNVVPPAAEVWYYIRANRHADVEQYFEWVKEIARGAAMSQGRRSARACARRGQAGREQAGQEREAVVQLGRRFRQEACAQDARRHRRGRRACRVAFAARLAPRRRPLTRRPGRRRWRRSRRSSRCTCPRRSAWAPWRTR